MDPEADLPGPDQHVKERLDLQAADVSTDGELMKLMRYHKRPRSCC